MSVFGKAVGLAFLLYTMGKGTGGVWPVAEDPIE